MTKLIMSEDTTFREIKNALSSRLCNVLINYNCMDSTIGTMAPIVDRVFHKWVNYGYQSDRELRKWIIYGLLGREVDIPEPEPVKPPLAKKPEPSYRFNERAIRMYHEYLTGDVTYAQLGEKHGISSSRARDLAMRGFRDMKQLGSNPVDIVRRQCP